MAWETRSIYEIAVFFLSATQLISDHGTEELWGIQSIFRGEFHFILLGQYNNLYIICQHYKRILEYFLYCLREDFGQSALDELYYADMHDNEHNVLAYSMTMRVRSISLLKSFYSKKKLGGGWGKGWTGSSFPVTMFEDNSPPQKFISLFVTFGVWVALVLLFQLFLCPFMQQQLQTTLCNAILLFHCLVLISRRVLVYFTLTVQHFSWNIMDFLNRTANLISFLVIVPQGVLNGALTDFLLAIIEIGSPKLWF